MSKQLSLNTQLTKLRSVIKLLKGTLSISVVKLHSGHTDTSRISTLRDIIYSLRDIQYELRGLTEYRAKRSAQINHYTIDDIIDFLSNELISQVDGTFHPLYRDNISTAKTELETVAHFLSLRQAKQELLNDELY